MTEEGLLKPSTFSLRLVRSEEGLAEALVPRLNEYIPIEPTAKQMAFLLTENLEVFFGGAVGGGKAQPLDSVVMTPFGERSMGEMGVGSVVLSSEGTPEKVIAVHERGFLPVWEFTFSDGAKCKTAEDHLWKYSIAQAGWKKSGIRWELATTAQMVEMFRKGVENKRHVMIPVCGEVQFTKNYRNNDGVRPIDPYLLGVLIGDGCLGGNCISVTSMDVPIMTMMCRELGNDNIVIDDKQGTECKTVKVVDGGSLKRLLGRIGLTVKSHEKFIPEAYKLGTVEDRWALVQGLMDTDGTASEIGRASYCTVSPRLADDFAWVIRSLGGRAHINSGAAVYTDKEGNRKVTGRKYIVEVVIGNKERLFRLGRKRDRVVEKEFNGGCSAIRRRLTGVKFIGEKECRCITVDNPDGLYLTNDFIVTHNSIALLAAALQYCDMPHYNALLIRATFQDLSQPEAVMSVAQDWLAGTGAKWNEATKTFRFPSGAKLQFGYLDGPNDHLKYKGAEFHFIGVDEAGDLRWKQVLYLFSRLRKRKGDPIPLRFRAASNPGGISHEHIYNRYMNQETRNGGSVFIASGMDDNPYLDKEEYDKSLKQLDAVTREQLRNGNWNVRDKGDLFDRDWFEVVPSAPSLKRVLRWWDLAGSRPASRGGKNKDPDWTAGVKEGLGEDGVVYILDVRHFRETPLYNERAITEMAELDGKECVIWMEQEMGSAGVTVCEHYQRDVLPGYVFKYEKSTGDKSVYAAPLSSAAEHGRIKLVRGRWNKEFLDELELWPNVAHDDMLDAAGKGYAKLVGRKKRAGAWGRGVKLEKRAWQIASA